MPLYEYQCQSCGKVSEALQKMNDPPLSTCEACGGPLKRLISAPAVQFKGSGWYVTDYARKGGESAKGRGAGEGAEKSEKADKTEKSGDAAAAPAAKPAESAPAAPAPAKSDS